MSTTIDSRVVEMKFDNSNFEKNAKQSMSTLEKLKNLINNSGSAKSLEDLGNAAANNNAKFSTLAASVETVGQKFSAMEVVAITALANIANRAIDTGIQLVKSLSVDNISAGFDKFSEKTRAVGTLMSQGFDMDTVTNQLDKLAWFTDETSYNFVDMVTEIGKFTATGQDLESSVTAMMGIANWAALSGQNAQKASSAMYQLSQAMSKGALKFDDWKSIANASMDTAEFREKAAAAAQAVGTLEKVGDDAYKTLKGKVLSLNDLFSGDFMSKQAWFTSDVMMTVFKEYAGAVDFIYDKTIEKNLIASEVMEQYAGEIDEFGLKAFKAAQEARTWGDVVDSVKDAVSSGWMNTFELLFGNYEQAKDLFSDLAEQLYTIFAEGSWERNDFIANVMNSSWGELSKKIEATGVDLDTFKEKAIETAKSHGIAIDEMIDETGSFEATLKNGWLSSGMFGEVIDGLLKDNKNLIDSNEEVTQSFKDYEQIVKEIIGGKWGNGADRMNRLAEAGYDYATAQDYVNRVLRGETVEFEKLTEAEIENLNITDEQKEALLKLKSEIGESDSELAKFIENLERPSGRELFIETIHNTLQIIIDTMHTAKEAWAEMFPPEVTQEKIYNFIERMRDLSKSMQVNEERGDKLKRSFKGLFAVLNIVKRAISDIVGGIVKLVSSFDSTNVSILDTTASIGDYLVSLDEAIAENDLFKKAIDFVVDGLKILINWVKNAATEIKNFIKKIEESKAFQEFYNFISTKFTNALEKMKTSLRGNNKLFEAMHGWFVKLKNDKLEDLFKKITEFFEKLNLESTKEKFESIKESLNTFKDAFISFFKDGDKEALVEAFGESFDKAKENIKAFCDTVKQYLVDLTPLLAAGGVIAAFIFFGKALNTLSNILKAVKSGFGILDGLNSVFSEMKKSIKKDVIVKIALALILLAGALWILSRIPHEDLKEAAIVLGILTVALAGLALAVGRMNKLSLGGGGSATAILALSASLAIIVGCLVAIYKLLEGRDLTDMFDAFTILGTVMIALLAVTMILSKFSPKMSTGGLGILAFSVALGIIINTLIKVADKNQAEKLKEGVNALMPVFVGLLAVSFIIDKFSANSGFGLLLTALGLVATLKVLEYIVNHPLDLEKIYENIGTLITIFGAMAALALIARIGGGKKAAGIIALALSMLIVGKAMQMLAEIPEEDFWKVVGLTIALGAVTMGLVAVSKNTEKMNVAGIIAIAAAMAVIAVELALLAKIKDTKALLSAAGALGACIVAFGYALSKAPKEMNLRAVLGIAAMVGAIWVVGHQLQRLAVFDWPSILAAGISMSLVLNTMGKVFETISPKSGVHAKKIFAFYGLCLSLYIVAGAIALLCGFEWSSLLAASVGLGIVLDTLGDVFKKISGTKGVKKEKILAFLEASLALLVIAGSIWILARYEWDSLLAAALSLSMCLFVLAESLNIIGKAKVDPKAGASLLIASVSLVVIGAALSMVATYNWENILAATLAINATLIALTVCSAILGSIGPAAIEGAAILDAIVALVVGFIGLLGYISEITGFKDAVDKGLEVLITISEGLGECIARFIASSLSTLPEIGQYLSDFMNNLQDFITGASAITPEAGTGMATLVSMLMSLVEAELVNGLLKLFGGDTSLSEIASELVAFGTEFASFTSTISEINDEDLDKSVKVIDCLAELMDKMPETASLKSKIFGGEKVSLQAFCKGLADAGDEIKSLGEVGKDINLIGIENYTKVISDYILPIADKMPEVSSWKTKIFGGEKKSLQDFCEGLANAGEEIKKLGEVGGQIQSYGVKAYCNMLTDYILPVSEKMPNLPSLKSRIFGGDQKSLQDFCEGLANAGAEVEELGTLGNQIQSDGVKRYLNMITEYILPVAEKMPESWSVKGLLKGGNQQSLADFCAGLGRAADNVKILSNKAAEIDENNVRKYSIAINVIVNLIERLSEKAPQMSVLKDFVNELKEFATEFSVAYAALVDGINIETFRTNIHEIGSAIQDLSSIGEIDSSVFDNIANLFKNLAKSGIDSMSTEFTNSQDAVAEAVNTMLLYIVNEVVLKSENAKLAMNKLVEGMIQAIRDKLMTIKIAMSGLLNAAILQANEYYPKFVVIGETIDTKIVEGMANNMEAIKAKARELAKAAYDAAMAELNSQNPTHVGGTFANNTAQGIYENTESAVNAASAMSNSVINAVDEGLNSESEFDTGLSTSMVAAATQALEDFALVFEESEETLIPSLDVMMQAIANEIQVQEPTVLNQFIDLIQAMLSELIKRQIDFKNAIFRLIRIMINAIIANKQSMVDAAYQYIGLAIVEGIEKAKPRIMAIVDAICDEIRKKIEEAMHYSPPNGPSNQHSNYLPMNNDYNLFGRSNPFIDSLTEWIEDLDNSNEELDYVLDGIREVLEDDMDLNPVITPTLDLSDVTEKARELGTILSNQTYSPDLQNGGNFNSNTSGTTFIQNNYSPKALSRIDIYRQTSRQLAMSKG